MSNKPIIQVENLTACYGDSVILKDVSFDVHAGEIFIILGGFGCGKSTLLKHMVGLKKPSSGRILIEGTDISAVKGCERHKLLRKFGVMYQNDALFGSMNLLENIGVVLEEFTSLPREAVELIAQMKLKAVGLERGAYKMPCELNRGMRKRAALARAIAMDPEIVFLDEPSAGLEAISSAKMGKLIWKLSRTLKITFVIFTHVMPSVLTVVDRISMLDRSTKNVLSPVEPRELCNNPWIFQFFNRQAEVEILQKQETVLAS